MGSCCIKGVQKVRSVLAVCSGCLCMSWVCSMWGDELSRAVALVYKESHDDSSHGEKLEEVGNMCCDTISTGGKPNLPHGRSPLQMRGHFGGGGGAAPR